MKIKLLIVFTFWTFNLFSQTNLVPNEGFETWMNTTTLADWTTENNVTQNTSNFTEGYKSAKLSITYSTVVPKIIAQVPMTAGITYTVKFKYKYVDTNYNSLHPISLNISKDGSATSLSSSTFATDNNWTVKETTFTPDQNMFYNLSISLFTFDDAAFNVNIDAVQVYIKGTEQYTLIPDVNFENKLIELGVDSSVVDGKVLTYDINKLTSLNVSSSSITDLTGIQDFVSLTHLDCSNNQLTTLNVSKSVNLTDLNCSKNKLTNLDLSSNAALIELNCYDNLLTSLNLKNGNNLNFAVQNSKFTSNPNLTCIQVDDAIYSNTNWSLIKDDTANFNTDCATAYLYTYIPDVNFEKKLIELGIDTKYADGKVLTSSISAITSLDVSIANISSLKGIDGFSALTALECGANQLTSLNLSKNTALTTLGCSGNQLTSLDLSKNTHLNNLDCASNQLTSLDLSKNTALTYILCNINKLINLDVTGCTALNELLAESNELTTLDLSNNFVLNRLSVNQNKLKTLNVRQNKALDYLNCNSNQLTALDLSQNTALADLVCSNNLLTSLNLSNNYELGGLDCSNNRLTELNTANNNKLSHIICAKNQLSVINVNNNPTLDWLDFTGNQIKVLDVSNNTVLSQLYCGSNQLTTLDVSKNTHLNNLDCTSNQLVSLNIKNGNNTNVLPYSVHFSNNPNLSCIQVDNKAYSDTNWLEFKDLTATYNADCTPYTLIPDSNFEQKLIDLGIDTDGLNGKISNAEANPISTLNLADSNISDLTGIVAFKSLATLNCAKNKLTSLDLSNNNFLTELDCSDNQLTSLNLKNGNNLNFTIQNSRFTNNTNLTCIQVDDETYSNNNWANAKDVIARYSTNCGNYTYIPDEYFEDKLISLGIDSGDLDGKVLTDNISSITSLNVADSNISDLTGIEDFISLTKLECENNKLSTLNISNNKLLKELNCSNNNLLTLNVSNNKLLKDLRCSYNNLTILDLSANSVLTSLECFYNQITTLDVSNMLELESLLCSGNQITDLDVTKNLHLYWFGCSSNKLTALDVSQNKILQFLDCGFNQLTSLDVSNNTALFDLNCYYNKLTSLDVSMLTGLTSLACSANQLSSLNISKNPILNSLMCESLNASTLDVSNNTALRELYCGNGQLTTLDVSQNQALTILYCQDNLLTNLNIKNGTNTQLTEVSFINNPNLTCIQVDDVTYSNSNWADKKDVTATYNEYCDYYTLIPDSNFEQKLIDLGIDTDGLNGKITIANINTITTLDLSNSNIKDLTGIENFTALNILDCSNNQLTSLDLSKNSNLQILYVTGNPLVYINLKNGNNQNLIVSSVTGKKASNTPGTSFLGLTALGCVKVDNADYSNANWSSIKETTTVYSETCTLGLEDSEFNKAIVYPNPTKGEINILNISLEKATVYNVLGQLVKTFPLDSANTNNTINLSDLPKGVYFVYLINQDAASAKKVIIE